LLFLIAREIPSKAASTASPAHRLLIFAAFATASMSSLFVIPFTSLPFHVGINSNE
jgi:hypothetical protein